MKLSHDPYQIFHASKTPVGLYARQKWLGEADTPLWEKDFNGTVTKLLIGQSPDGSWHHSTVDTINHLFGLHLTVRSPNTQINAALNWLLKKVDLSIKKTLINNEYTIIDDDLKGLPFVQCRPTVFLTSATLFLSSIFGLETDQNVLALYQRLISEDIKSKGKWFEKASAHNILRAMIVHPLFVRDKATKLAVENLANLQTDRGDWGNGFPFYHTLNALAHVDFPLADTQLEKAFRWLFEKQNNDGTWSLSEPEWNTFLAIHALKNKGVL